VAKVPKLRSKPANVDNPPREVLAMESKKDVRLIMKYSQTENWKTA